MDQHPQLVTIGQPKVFSKNDAEYVLRTIYRLSEKASQKVDTLVRQMEAFREDQKDLIRFVENQINNEVHEWQNKIEKLGATPRGLWMVDLDSGDGFYCWKFPEKEILYWHAYKDGFSKRVELSEKHLKFDLQKKLRQTFLHP